MATIRLNKKNNTIKVVNRKKSISLKRDVNFLKLDHFGKPGGKGDKGDDGEPGKGIPEGGLDGQFLAKVGNEDYEYQWLTPQFTGDKTAMTEFTVSKKVAFTHGLNKYPAVSVIDSAGDEVVGSVEYVDTNSVIVNFAAAFSGRVTCN